ncbi:MAG: type II toxin-antitoxin system MqsA family antitoxin [Pseudomonas sp.]|uniref:type II toxin-antitoxin system MqsA family antitoxin n=1 Tax=Pseudomonas sp. TaxID=306 RepID=UPI003D143208
MKRQCSSCGAPNGMHPFSQRSETIDFRHMVHELQDLSGWECQVCGEAEFDAQSAERHAKAGDQLIADYRQIVAQQMKRIRRKLHLSQQEAVKLLSGGGHNAFSRYERAEVSPPQPLYLLMRLLDHQPQLMELIRELSQPEAVPPAQDVGSPAALQATGN